MDNWVKQTHFFSFFGKAAWFPVEVSSKSISGYSQKALPVFNALPSYEDRKLRAKNSRSFAMPLS